MKVIDKLKKLFALADGNANEHERNRALEAAKKLMDEYNIKEYDLQGSGDELPHGIDEEATELKSEPWQRQIIASAAHLNNVEIIIRSQRVSMRGRRKQTVVLIGTEINRYATIAMATYLMESVRLESNRVVKDQPSRRSFRVGAAESIHIRCIDLKEQGQYSGTGTELMVISDALDKANQDYLDKKYPDMESRRPRKSIVQPAAYFAGRSYGDTVDLQGKRIQG